MFFLIPLLVERLAVPAITAVVRAQAALLAGAELDLAEQLRAVRGSLGRMTAQLSNALPVLHCTVLHCTALHCTDHASAEEMHAGCSPALFYHAHRPLLSGWRDNPALPEGLVYEVTLPRNSGTPLLQSAKCCLRRFVITEKAPTRAFS